VLTTLGLMREPRMPVILTVIRASGLRHLVTVRAISNHDWDSSVEKEDGIMSTEICIRRSCKHKELRILIWAKHIRNQFLLMEHWSKPETWVNNNKLWSFSRIINLKTFRKKEQQKPLLENFIGFRLASKGTILGRMPAFAQDLTGRWGVVTR
jgi:hypothetical protein